MRLRLIGSTLALGLAACQNLPQDDVSLARRGSSGRPLRVGEHVPAVSEAQAVGASRGAIERDGSRFESLIACASSLVVFKDEEGTGADRLMTRRLCDALVRLGTLVGRRWPGVRVRVTEAWDERGEHGQGSLHYEGRAVDLTASDRDGAKLGTIARLAHEAGFDWVYFEDRSHVHASVRP